MSEYLITIGFITVFIGILLVIAGSVSGAASGESKVAVAGFIGPIPFGFGNDPRMLRMITVAAFAIFLVVFLLPMLMRGAA
ncbi:MAG: DUF131 domain-containing protein [archaeon]